MLADSSRYQLSSYPKELNNMFGALECKLCAVEVNMVGFILFLGMDGVENLDYNRIRLCFHSCKEIDI
jgi:hypothetical protein